MSTEDYVGQVLQVGGRSYVVEKIVAEGGFALVFQVRDLTGSGHVFAAKRVMVNNEADLKLAKQEIAIMDSRKIKKIKIPKVTDEGWNSCLAQWRRREKALSSHHSSVTFHDYCINDQGGDIYEILMIMKLYTGGTVLEMMNKRLDTGFQEHEILSIFSDIVLTVSRLHHRTKPIMHRDLKVENILRSEEGHYVLCDYGSCHICEIDPAKMGVRECEDEIKRFTTMAYRAPEMVDLYSNHKITTKSDIWALGCLLYKLCFFTTPFGEQPLAILRGQFTIPDNSKYSDRLHRLIGYMLELNPDKRPDIFQVANVLFKLKGEKNPVPNVFHSCIPPAELPRPLTESEAKATGSAPTKKKMLGPQVVETSILARERPRSGLSPNPNRRGASPQRPRSPQNQNGAKPHQSQAKPHQSQAKPLQSQAKPHQSQSQSDKPVMNKKVHHSKPPERNNQTNKHNSQSKDQFGATPFSSAATYPQAPPIFHTDDDGIIFNPRAVEDEEQFPPVTKQFCNATDQANQFDQQPFQQDAQDCLLSSQANPSFDHERHHQKRDFFGLTPFVEEDNRNDVEQISQKDAFDAEPFNQFSSDINSKTSKSEDLFGATPFSDQRSTSTWQPEVRERDCFGASPFVAMPTPKNVST